MNTARTAVDFGLAVLIWLVQLIIYPSFSYLSADRLADWHPRYTNLITLIVGPLMLVQVGLVGWELLRRPSGYVAVSAGLVALMWAVTAFGAVPLHNAIAAGDASPATLAKLVNVNWYRTIGWTLVFALGLLSHYARLTNRP